MAYLNVSSTLAFLALVAVLKRVIKPLFNEASVKTGIFFYGDEIQLAALSSPIAFGTGFILVGGFLSFLSYFLVLETVERHRGKEIVPLKELENIFVYIGRYF